MLGKHGDGFTFGEVFGSRIWQRADYPAAALFVMRSNQALKVVGKKYHMVHGCLHRTHAYICQLDTLIDMYYVYIYHVYFIL